MLKPESMSKLFVAGPKSALPKVVSRLHELKVAHIIEHKKDKFDICQPLKDFDRISSLLVQLRSTISHLGINAEDAKLKELKIPQIEKDFQVVKEEASQAVELLKRIEDELSLISEQKKALETLSLLHLSPDLFRKSRLITQFFGYVDSSELKHRLHTITSRFEIKTEQHDKKTLAAIFVDSEFSEQFAKALAELSFSEIDLSPVKELRGNSKELLERLSKRHALLETQLGSAKKKIASISKKHSTFLSEAEKFMSIEAEKSQIPLSFGSTRETFFLKAYIPKNSIANVKEQLLKASGGRIYAVEESIGHDEDIPIKLNNSRYVKNSEFFTKLFALPKYDEFDPSALIAYTFPLFFGFMLGDVIYGLITFALFFYLKKKIPAGRQFFNMMLAASIGAIIFGFLYGEFAGLELYHFWIERTHDFDALMMISIIAGIIHVNFGLMLGFINEYRHHGLMKAANAKFSWVLLQIGGVLFLGPLLSMLVVSPILFYLGIFLFVIAVIMLLKAEGFTGIMEIPSILTHIMSYARLMAVGLASVFIAVMVNDLVTFLFHKGMFFWPLALIALVVGHTFNIALGILSPSLHSIRLHYVEFFSKFYQGGGSEYRPFGAEKEKSLI